PVSFASGRTQTESSQLSIANQSESCSSGGWAGYPQRSSRAASLKTSGGQGLSKSQFPVPPPPALPCCLPGPMCQTIVPDDCVKQGGVVLSPDRPCSTDPCPGAG